MTIASPHSDPHSPGDENPAIPERLARGVNALAGATQDPDARAHYTSLAQTLRIRALDMMRTGDPRSTWWQPDPPPSWILQSQNEMTYECDANLGSPSLVDCSRQQWQGLEPSSDTVTISPGIPKSYLSSKPNTKTNTLGN